MIELINYERIGALFKVVVVIAHFVRWWFLAISRSASIISDDHCILEQTQKTYKRSYDKKAQPAPPFKVGDLV